VNRAVCDFPTNPSPSVLVDLLSAAVLDEAEVAAAGCLTFLIEYLVMLASN
jgi:hypothetical protein